MLLRAKADNRVLRYLNKTIYMNGIEDIIPCATSCHTKAFVTVSTSCLKPFDGYDPLLSSRFPITNPAPPMLHSLALLPSDSQLPAAAYHCSLGLPLLAVPFVD